MDLPPAILREREPNTGRIDRSIRQQQQALDHIPQLPHVPGP